MKPTKINIEHTCDNCENGVVQNPIFAEYWKEVKAGNVDDKNPTASREWFLSRACNPDFEKEEIDCDICNGTHTVSKKVSIEDFKTMIGLKSIWNELSSIRHSTNSY